jgi:hypothetical protein
MPRFWLIEFSDSHMHWNVWGCDRVLGIKWCPTKKFRHGTLLLPSRCCTTGLRTTHRKQEKDGRTSGRSHNLGLEHCVISRWLLGHMPNADTAPLVTAWESRPNLFGPRPLRGRISSFVNDTSVRKRLLMKASDEDDLHLGWSHYAMKTYGFTPRPLYPWGKQPPVPTGYEVGWTDPRTGLDDVVKVKLSLYRPWRPLRLRQVEAPTFSDIRLIDGGKVVSPTSRRLITTRKIPGNHFW